MPENLVRTGDFRHGNPIPATDPAFVGNPIPAENASLKSNPVPVANPTFNSNPVTLPKTFGTPVTLP